MRPLGKRLQPGGTQPTGLGGTDGTPREVGPLRTDGPRPVRRPILYIRYTQVLRRAPSVRLRRIRLPDVVRSPRRRIGQHVYLVKHVANHCHGNQSLHRHLPSNPRAPRHRPTIPIGHLGRCPVRMRRPQPAALLPGGRRQYTVRSRRHRPWYRLLLLLRHFRSFAAVAAAGRSL